MLGVTSGRTERRWTFLDPWTEVCSISPCEDCHLRAAMVSGVRWNIARTELSEFACLAEADHPLYFVVCTRRWMLTGRESASNARMMFIKALCFRSACLAYPTALVKDDNSSNVGWHVSLRKAAAMLSRPC